VLLTLIKIVNLIKLVMLASPFLQYSLAIAIIDLT